MRFRKWIATLCVIAALSTFWVSAAGLEPRGPNSTVTQTAQAKDWKAKADAAKAKWETLPDKQKAEVYALMDQKMADEIKMMEKYRDLGIIDDEVLNRFKEKYAEKAAAIRKSGELPLFAEKMKPNEPSKKNGAM